MSWSAPTVVVHTAAFRVSIRPLSCSCTGESSRCSAGRPAGPNNGFSTIAGFVEPGESLEDTIRREVAEETNIRVGAATYVASQPWPFPSALMIGFHAEGLSTDIRLNDGELAEARWVSRLDITEGNIILPPKMSVAYHLIATWFDQYDGPKLESFALPDSPLQVRKR